MGRVTEAVKVDGALIDRLVATLAQLAFALEQLNRPAIPVEIDLWDVGMIAAYLKRDVQVVRSRKPHDYQHRRAGRNPSTK